MAEAVNSYNIRNIIQKKLLVAGLNIEDYKATKVRMSLNRGMTPWLFFKKGGMTLKPDRGATT